MRPIYCISGLGADERIFTTLSIPGAKLVPLQWILPLEKESIEAYAVRMLQQVRDHQAAAPNPVPTAVAAQVHAIPPCILGVSFGGMMAIEMAKHCPGAEVILVSSVKSRRELPRWMKLAGNWRLNKLVPLRPPRWRRLEDSFLGATTREELQLVEEFRKTANPHYLRWAIGQILNWQNEWQPPVCHHIHGSRDRTFPIRHIRPTHIIPGGGHFMIMNRSAEMNEILAGIC